MTHCLGIDVGTNSIGWSGRTTMAAADFCRPVPTLADTGSTPFTRGPARHSKKIPPACKQTGGHFARYKTSYRGFPTDFPEL